VSVPPLGRGLWVALLVLPLIHTAVGASEVQKADAVLVVKSEKRLYLLDDGEAFASYHATFGGDPEGHKQRQGDGRTPEGRYVLDYKNSQSAYYRSIHVSYPNRQDRRVAKDLGVNPGGDIMVHGQPNGWGWAGFMLQTISWTDGCIALTDSDMDQVWQAVDPGIPIEIRP
jgi:murein L,D-transpeptidase YafK